MHRSRANIPKRLIARRRRASNRPFVWADGGRDSNIASRTILKMRKTRTAILPINGCDPFLIVALLTGQHIRNRV